jgi:ribosomal protein L11 methyltransferase
MYLWRRTAAREWWSTKENEILSLLGNRLAIIEQPTRKRLQLEASCKSRKETSELIKRFQGRAEKLPRDWLKRFWSDTKARPLKIGSRLIVVRLRRRRSSSDQLIIPAGAAFGTGEHVTTAMALRVLERLTRQWKFGWSLVDLGTGSGILALAAKHFGAGRVLAIDVDPIAISTAKQNARINRIAGVQFRVKNARNWRCRHKVDIACANLFSELLIAVLPKLKRIDWLILSGILREQGREVTRALGRNQFDIVEIRRRGKWMAILAQKRV